MLRITIALLALALLACGGSTAVAPPTIAPTAAVIIPTEELPTLAPTFTPSPQKFEFEGNNDRVVSFTVGQAGNVQFGAAQYDEGLNFYIWLKDVELNDLELIANCIDVCEETTAVRLEPGTYYLDISNTFTAEWYVVVIAP